MKKPQISEAEFEVMKIIWEYAPISTNDITDKLVSKTQWNPKTIHTLLKRLVQKNAITYQKQSRLFVYTPLIKKEEYIQQQNHSFLQRFYNGNFSYLFASYLDNEDLTEEDINELKSILENHSQNKDNK